MGLGGSNDFFPAICDSLPDFTIEQPRTNCIHYSLIATGKVPVLSLVVIV